MKFNQVIEFIVGLAAALVILIGLGIMAGPGFFSRVAGWARLGLGLAHRRIPAKPSERRISAMHPSAHAAMEAAMRLASSLRAGGHQELSRALEEGAMRLPSDEAGGLLRLHTACRSLRRLLLSGGRFTPRFRELLDELETTVADRGEQLELLPFR